jgi:hypothetical protein
MRRVLITLGLGALAAIGLATGLATAGLVETNPPNQGDPDKVLTVESGYNCSGTMVAGEKVEGGDLGPTITVTATSPIVQVTIKSGSKAEVVAATWSADFLSGTITIAQDVSNYVVWTCSGTTTTTDTTDTTDTTPTDTTPTDTTPTDTTPTDTTPTDTSPTTPTDTTPTDTTPTITTDTTPTTTPDTTPTTTTDTTPTTTTETTPTALPTGPLTPPKAPTKPSAPKKVEKKATKPAAKPTKPTVMVKGVVAENPPKLAYTP